MITEEFDGFSPSQGKTTSGIIVKDEFDDDDIEIAVICESCELDVDQCVCEICLECDCVGDLNCTINGGEGCHP